MKRIKNADINFKLNPKRINLNNFSMKFYTVNSEAYFFIKDQDNLVSVERDATIYDEDVIISGGTKVLDYYLPLDWSELVQLGEGVLNYRCINNIEDPYFPDMAYNQVIEDTTGYYIDSDIIVDPSQTRNIIERVTELESGLAVESIDREEADTFISGAVDTEVARAISAETELSERIDAIESGASEALDAEIERAISAETALQDAIDDEEARAITIENAIRQDLTNESELRSSADTAMWTAINDEIVRSTSAETVLDNKIDVENLRAIGVENAISGDLQTYKATNNAALQAETTRATSAETALQSAINDEATARANADTALQTAITNEVSRAREAESGITNSLNAEVTRATGAENALDDKIDAETTRATGAEAALDVKIGTVSGNVITEATRATTAENALSGAIDSISAATSGSVEELDAKIDTVSGNVITEEARAKGVENALSGAIDTLDVRFFDDAKYEDSGNTKVINFYNGNVVKATIDCTDFLVDGMIDDVYIENGYLVIDFNTASGKQDIRIPLTDIFNPANYYTKSETSGATEISTALAQKLAISDFNTYSGNVATALGEKASQSTVDALSGTVTGHTSDSVIHVTSSDKEKWNKVDDKADTTAVAAVNNAITAHTADTSIHLTSGNVQTQIDNSISGKADSSDVYLKSETSGATEIATALSGKQATLVSGENIKTINNQSLLGSGNIDIQGGGGGGISSAECQTMIDNSISGKANSSDVYLKSETSGATEIATALAQKLAISDFNTYSGAVDTTISSKASQSDLDTLSGTVTAHTADTTVHVTASDKTKWNKVDDKADTTAVTAAIDAAVSGKANSSDVYLKSETSGATELSNAFAQKLGISDFNTYSGAVDTALSGKQATLVSSENIKTINNQSLLGSGNIDIQGGGGGKAIEAGRGIAITTGETADTVSFNLPIYSGTGEGSIIGGFSGNTASGKYSIALGGRYENKYDYQYCKASGQGAISFGGTASGQGAFSCGENTQALGSYSVAFGGTTKAIGIESFVIGRKTTANTFASFAQGWFTKTTNEAEVALGEYNNSVSASTTFGNSGNTLFSVGNGTTSARHNAFEIRQNGDIYLTKDGQDVKLQDQLGGGGGGITSGEVQTMIDQSISGKTNQSDFTGHTADTSIHVTTAQTAAWDAKSNFSGDYNDLTNKPTIPTVPTNVSDFTNDAGYITSNDISGKTNQSDFTAHTANTTVHVTSAEKATWNAKSDFSGSYNDLTDKPTIPTVPTSNTAFTNDAGYITANDITGKTDVTAFTAHTGDTTAHVTSAEKAAWNAKSDFSGSYNDLTNKLSAGTNITIVDNVISATGGGGGGMTEDDELLLATALTDLNDRKIDASEVKSNYQKKGDYVTTDTLNTRLADYETALDEQNVEEVTAYALNDLNLRFGGLKIVKITESEYAALTTKDENTLYIVVADQI